MSYLVCVLGCCANAVGSVQKLCSSCDVGRHSHARDNPRLSDKCGILAHILNRTRHSHPYLLPNLQDSLFSAKIYFKQLWLATKSGSTRPQQRMPPHSPSSTLYEMRPSKLTRKKPAFARLAILSSSSMSSSNL